MNDIQVDMYPVGLGSAMLLQFTDKYGKRVRILADGGVGRGKDPKRVRDALLGEFLLEGGQQVRLDLVVGTHYDEDHLSGLVPIIEDERFQIGEIWLPPIINDIGDMHKEPIQIENSVMLAHQFNDEKLGSERLSRYLQAKTEIIAEVVGFLERNEATETGKSQLFAELRTLSERLKNTILESPIPEVWQRPISEFRDIEQCAGRCFHLMLSAGHTILGNAYADKRENYIFEEEIEVGHADQYWEYPPWNWDESDIMDRKGKYIISKLKFAPFNGVDAIRAFLCAAERPAWKRHSGGALHVTSALLEILKGQARDAINAKTLSDVVGALRARNKISKTRVELHCHVISAGKPLRLGWDMIGRRFVASDEVCKDNPSLKVMAPSDGLIQKHYTRLPVGRLGLMAALFEYDLKWVTPSNQLSYVVRAEYKGQGILVSGDTGMVDFVRRSRRPRKYEEALLKELMPLHVVQVAHHGGRNWYFYEVLMKAGYSGSQERSYLLLSHAVNDHHRPSGVFAEFMLDLRKGTCNATVLFTSRPKSDRVCAFGSMVERPVGPSRDEGPIRVSFKQGRWSVDQHWVRV